MQELGVQLYSALESGIEAKIKVKIEQTTGWKVSFIYNNQVICSFEDTKIIRARLRCYLYLIEYFDTHNIASRTVYTNLYQQYCLGVLQAVNGAFLVVEPPTVNDSYITSTTTDYGLVNGRYITVATTEYGFETAISMLEGEGYTYKKLNRYDFLLSKRG